MNHSESAREHELYKFYTPWLNLASGNHVALEQINAQDAFQGRSTFDKALSAFAQLGIRCLNVERGMVSLIDSKTQIVLAEAIQSLSLVDDHPQTSDDHTCLGPASFARRDGICQHVFGSFYTATDRDKARTANALVVSDVHQDDRFHDNPYVLRWGIRFYAGVPIMTSGGNTIGVYSVFSGSPRAALSVDELLLMEDVAATVYEHLKMVKSLYDRDRGDRMVEGLASFIEDLSALKNETDHNTDTSQNQEARPNDPRDGSNSSTSVGGLNGKNVTPTDSPVCGRVTSRKEEGAFQLPPDKSKSLDSVTSISNSMQIFGRVSKILRESTKSNGCVFFDASLGKFSDEHMQLSDWSSPNQSKIQEPSAGRKENRDHKLLLARVLGFSVEDRDSGLSASLAFPKYQLEECLERYPRGTIFDFSGVDVSASEDENVTSDLIDPPSGKGRKRARNNGGPFNVELFKHLHGVQTVIFLPLFDYINDRWLAGGFLWTSGRGQISYPDMPYLKAFGSCIMSEVAGMEALRINKAKTTFIASISHELRSPLNGILGSCEFLEETLSTAYQTLLMGTIQTCGNTLLDTIDHLLDHAKINNLTKTIPPRFLDGPSTFPEACETSTSSTNVNLALLVEEVIEAVFAGQTFKKAGSRGATGKSCDQQEISPISELPNKFTTQGKSVELNDDKFCGRVIVVLDVENAASWCVKSQSGGLRRVVMNLFGNSIKYCESGYISACLRVQRTSSDILTFEFILKDTGRGMSKEFMSRSLFRPFTQEDSFSFGTGLGLSIIKQIVDSMSGKVEIESQKGVGTEARVTISLPLVKEESPRDDISTAALQVTRGKKMCTFHSNFDTQSKESDAHVSKLSASVAKTCREWFDMEFLEDAAMDTDADVFLYLEPPLIEGLRDRYVKRKTKEGGEIAWLIICTNAFEAASLRAAGVDYLTSLGKVVEVISQPVGPQKLAKVLLQIFRRLEESTCKPNPARPSTPSTERSNDLEWSNPDYAGPKKNPDSESGESEEPYPNIRHGSTIKLRRDSYALPHVLVVDDNPINLQLLATFLRKNNISFEEAVNGLDALAKYKEGLFDFVLMDVSMPIMDGLQSSSKIREHERNAKLRATTIVALTGLASATVQEEAFAAGVSHFMAKPVRFKELKQLLLPD